jgi:hypothetical protein
MAIIITARTVGDINVPRNSVQAKYSVINAQGLFCADLVVRKAIAQRRIKGVWFSVCVHINVNIRNAKVALPIPDERMLFIEMPGTKARAARHSILGQSMEIVIHIISTPIKIPTTCIAATERPAGAGINLKNSIKIIERAMIKALFWADTFIISPFHKMVMSPLQNRNDIGKS